MRPTAIEPSRIEAVIFDMDGLMLDTEPISLRVWREAAATLGFTLDDAIARRMVGRSRAGNRELLRDYFGPALPFDELARLAGVRYREALDAGGVPRKPGLIELLESLAVRQVHRAVVTSTAIDLARHKLERAGVLDRFDVIVGGDEVARGKPSPDGFLLAASRLGTDPGRCIVLEDSGPGIEAAHAAGMTAVLVPDACEPEADIRRLAYTVAESLDAARLVITELLGPASASAEGSRS